MGRCTWRFLPYPTPKRALGLSTGDTMSHIGSWLQHLIHAVKAGDRDAIQGMSVGPDPAVREAAVFAADPCSGIWGDGGDKMGINT